MVLKISAESPRASPNLQTFKNQKAAFQKKMLRKETKLRMK